MADRGVYISVCQSYVGRKVLDRSQTESPNNVACLRALCSVSIHELMDGTKNNLSIEYVRNLTFQIMDVDNLETTFKDKLEQKDAYSVAIG
ncbi:unnamed protein product [Arctia plantaginis]|uniref:Uncharacterized protein n=1 Tax=Arctia plantaginis TaxID=874455 RepID=A0A8S0YYM8_ARCPL|nr:unnamed protein product [Arctia plantaginis]